MAMEGSIYVAELAKIFCQNGFNVTDRSLYAILRADGYLCNNDNAWNKPCKKYMDNDMMRISPNVYTKHCEDCSKLCYVAMITPKGQEHLINRYCKTSMEVA